MGPRTMSESRHKFNRMLHTFMKCLVRSAISQLDICFGFFRGDRVVHLSYEGCDLYLSSLPTGIRAVFPADVGQKESS